MPASIACFCRSKCKSENDREARLAQVLVGSESPEEALLKRCAHFDLQGKAKTAVAACDAIIATRQRQLDLCKEELVRQVAYARDAIKVFEGKYPTAKLKSENEAKLRANPRLNFDLWQNEEVKDCGDADANALMGPLVAKGLAIPPNAKVGARSQRGGSPPHI